MDVSIVIIFTLICVLCSTTITGDTDINKFGYCGDASCSVPIGEGFATINYTPDADYKLNVKAGTKFLIFVKGYGPKDLVGIELLKGNIRGYIPTHAMQETVTLKKNHELVPAYEEFLHKDQRGKVSYENIQLKVNPNLIEGINPNLVEEVNPSFAEVQSNPTLLHNSDLHSRNYKSESAESYTDSQYQSNEELNPFPSQSGNLHHHQTGSEMHSNFLPDSIPATPSILQQHVSQHQDNIHQQPLIQSSSEERLYHSSQFIGSGIIDNHNTPFVSDSDINLQSYQQHNIHQQPYMSQENSEFLSSIGAQQYSVPTVQSGNLQSNGFVQSNILHQTPEFELSFVNQQNSVPFSPNIYPQSNDFPHPSQPGIEDQQNLISTSQSNIATDSVRDIPEQSVYNLPQNSFSDQSQIVSSSPQNVFPDQSPTFIVETSQNFNPQANSLSPKVKQSPQSSYSEQTSSQGSLEHTLDKFLFSGNYADQFEKTVQQQGHNIDNLKKLYSSDTAFESSQGKVLKKENTFSNELPSHLAYGSDQPANDHNFHEVDSQKSEVEIGVNTSQKEFHDPSINSEKIVIDTISSVEANVEINSDETVMDPTKVLDSSEHLNSTASDNSNVDDSDDEDMDDLDDDEEPENEEEDPESEEDEGDLVLPIGTEIIYVKENDSKDEKKKDMLQDQSINSKNKTTSQSEVMQELSNNSSSDVNIDDVLSSGDEIPSHHNLSIDAVTGITDKIEDKLINEPVKDNFSNPQLASAKVEELMVSTAGDYNLFIDNSSLSTNDSFSQRRGLVFEEDANLSPEADRDNYLNPEISPQEDFNGFNGINISDKEDLAAQNISNISDSIPDANAQFPYQTRHLKGEQDVKDNQSVDVLDENIENVTYTEFDFYMQVQNSLEAVRSFIEVLLSWMPEPLYSILMDLKAQGVSPRVPVFTAISAVPCFLLIISVVYIKEKSKEKKLIARLAVVEKNVYTLAAEKNIIKEKLEKTEVELQSTITTLHEEREGFDKMKNNVESLNQSIEKANMEIAHHLEEIKLLKEREREYTELVSDHEKVYLELQSEKTLLEKDLVAQDNTIKGIQDQLEDNEKEIKQLQKEKLEYAQSNEEYEEKLSLLQQNCNQLLKEAEVWNIRVNELSSKLQEETALKEDLDNNLKIKDNEIESLTNLVQTFKAFEEADSSEEERKSNEEKLKCLMNSSNILIKLHKQEDENRLLFEKLSTEKNKILEMEVELLEAKSECDKLKVTYNQALQDKAEAQTKLDVLTNYFKDKEIMLQKQLGVQEAFRERREKDADAAERQIILIEQENASYKYQVASMKQEMEETERNLKSQIAAQEKKAHENWIAARAAERKLEDMKQEVTQLRQRLTLLEREQEKWANSPREDVIRPIPKRISGVNDSTMEDTNVSIDSRLGMFPPPLPPMMLPPDRPLPPLLHPHLPPPPFEPSFRPWHLPPDQDFRSTPPEFAHGRESTPPRGRYSAVNDRDIGPRQSSPLGEERRDSRNSTPPHSLPDFHAIPPPPRPFFPLPGHPRYPLPPPPAAFRR